LPDFVALKPLTGKISHNPVLIAEHRSIDRSLVQIQMQRMSKFESIEIIDKGLARCDGITVEMEVKMRMADYSQGLPPYAHLLAKTASLRAVIDNRTAANMADLEAAVRDGADTQLETNVSSYRLAVTAPRETN
jgi:hypothetical protein